MHGRALAHSRSEGKDNTYCIFTHQARQMNLPNLPAYSQEQLRQACSELEIRLLILFGSRARIDHRVKPESDLDLGVLFRPGIDPKRFGRCFGVLTEVFPGSFLDIGFLNQTDSLFRFEVVREGVLLFGEEMDFLEYKAFAFRDYFDSQDLRDLEEKLFQRKMTYVRTELNKPVKSPYDTP